MGERSWTLELSLPGAPIVSRGDDCVLGPYPPPPLDKCDMPSRGGLPVGESAFLVIIEVEHLVIYLVPICTSSLEKDLLGYYSSCVPQEKPVYGLH